MARPIPQIPLDGEQYSGLFNGVPVVLEYDESCGAYKLVVAQEYAVNFMISGVVALEPGDIEIGAVEIKDFATDDRAHVDTSHLLHVCLASGTIWTIAVVQSDKVEDTQHVTGDWGNFNLSVRQDAHGPSGHDNDYVAFLSNEFGYLKVWTTGSFTFADTELPDAVALADATATPTAPAIGAFGHAWDEVDETWDRLRNEGISGSYALRTSIMGETEDGFEHVSVDTDGHPQVDVLTTPYLDKDLDEVTAYVTGSVRIVDSDGDEAGVTADGCLQVSVCTGTIVADTELPDAAALADATATPTAPAVGSFGHAWDEIDSTWDRLRQVGASGSYGLRVAPLGQMEDGINYSPLQVRALGDNFSDPDHALQVQSFLMGYYTLGGVWQRLTVDADESLRVTISTGSIVTPHLDKDLDEVTAYVTGSVRIVDSDGDEAGVTADGCLQVSVCTGTIVADTELPDAAVLSDDFDNPTAPAVGAFGMGYYPASGTWSRLTVDENDALQVSISSDIQIGAVEIKDGDTDQRAGVTADGCLQVQVCTGSVVVGDGGGSLTVDDGGQSLTVDGSVTVQNLDKDSDEVTAYVTGTVRLVDSDGDEAGISADGCLQVQVCTGTVVADTELPVAEALSDEFENPTAPAVGAFGMGYYPASGTWSRLTVDEDDALRVSLSSDIQIGAVEIKDGDSDQRAGVTADGCLQVQVCTGSVVVGDGGGSLTVDDGGASLTVDGSVTVQNLDKDSDEVTAYVTGTVRLVDSDGDEAGITADGCLQVSVCTGTVVADTELPAAASLADATATPTAPAVGSFPHGWDEVDNTWDRLRNEGASGSYALRTASWGMAPSGYRPILIDDDGHLQIDILSDPVLDKDTDEITAYVTGTVRLVDSEGNEAGISADGCLQVSICTGTVIAHLEAGDIEIGAVEIKDGDSDQRAGVTADGCLQVAICTGTVVAEITGQVDTELPAAAVLTDAFGNPTAPAVGAFNMFWDWDDTEWQRWYGAELNVDFTPSQIDKAPVVLSVLCGIEQTGSHYRSLVARTDIPGMVQPLEVWTTGSTVVADTELSAAQVMSDGMANPTAPAVASSLMGFNGLTWDRLYMGVSGSLKVDLATRLDQINDAVTAYVTGSVGLVDADGNLAGITSDGCLQVSICTGSVVVEGSVTADTELPTAAALADATATPTAPAIGGFGHAWDEVDSTWDRLRQEGASGSYALRTSSWGMAPSGYRPVLLDNDGHLQVDALTAPALVKTTDEVTAYVTGTVRIVDSDGHEAGVSADGCLQVAICTGTVVADVSLDQATDSIEAYLTADSEILLAGQTKTIERLPINITGTSAEYMLITGTAGSQVHVMEVMLIASADTQVIFKSGAGGTWLTGPLSLPADGDGFFCGSPATPDLYHFRTEVGDILMLEIIGGAQIGGWINWYDG